MKTGKSADWLKRPPGFVTRSPGFLACSFSPQKVLALYWTILAQFSPDSKGRYHRFCVKLSLPLPEIRLKGPIISEKNLKRLADHVTSIGRNECSIAKELIIGSLVDSKAAGYSLCFGLWLNPRTGLRFSCV